METIIAAALIVALLMAGFFGGKSLFDALTSRRAGRPAVAFAAPLSADAHWARVASVVDRSVARASLVVSSQRQAAHQLDAADYALHSLLRDLESVMPGVVASPLERKHRPGAAKPEAAPAAIAA